MTQEEMKDIISMYREATKLALDAAKEYKALYEGKRHPQPTFSPSTIGPGLYPPFSPSSDLYGPINIKE